MCGIVGYLGTQDACPILLKGLHRLEYRGYDSAGVSMISSETGNLNVFKAKGKVADLEAFLADKDISGTIGIAHTRWATHGVPCRENAHPHCSSSGTLSLIHNGIIENYATLKERLIEKGFTFQSETDTEVLVQLIEYYKMTKGFDLLAAVQHALAQVIGAYAIAVIDKNNPDELIAARKASPLAIGLGDGEFFLASDATPLVEYTKKIIYLEDNEIAVINRHEGVRFVTIQGDAVSHEASEINIDLGAIEKGGFPHFMLKEIFEQPDCLINSMKGRIDPEGRLVRFSSIIDHRDRIINARRFIIVACGTSWHAGLIGKSLIENFCRIPVEVAYASEFRYNNPVINKDDVVIAISQSGETADTLAAIELARESGAFVYGIVNSVGSSIARNTQTGCYIHVGPEIGVASTKAFTGQVTILTMLALCIAKERNTISQEELEASLKELLLIPDKMREILKSNDAIASLSRTFTYAHNFIYLGRGYNYPVALEGALKLKEISYIHAEGYPAAEMKHGPIALIDAEMPVVVVATNRVLYEKILSNIQEIKARQGKVIAIVMEGDETISKIVDYVIELPKTAEFLCPLLASVPLQLLAYHIAVCKGKDVDQPRNLAKSVTVE